MYKFLTEQENFENMIKVVGMKDLVRNRLIVDFWGLVMEKLKALSESDGGRWQVLGPKSKDGFFETYSTINLIKPAWEDEKKVSPIGVGWQSLSGFFYHGIWANPAHPTISNSLKAHFKQLNLSGYRSDLWWIIFSTYGYNLNDFSHLEHILPSKQEALADEFAKLVFNLALQYEADLDKAIANTL